MTVKEKLARGELVLCMGLRQARTVDTAMIGRDGAANAMAALNGQISFHKAIVQVAGRR